MGFLLARNWWVLVVRGALAIVFGLLAFAWPGVTLESLVLLFGIYALADGVFSLISTLTGGRGEEPMWALVLEGITGIAAGVLTFLWPGVTAFVLLMLIAAWAVVTGAFEIAAAFRLWRHVHGEWMLLFAGVLSILFGVACFASPVAGAMAVLWMIATYAIIFGITLIGLGFRLRSFAGLADAGRTRTPTTPATPTRPATA
jgi:uncharacterized membrane protein HdeD (DUF308 family)